MAVSRAYSAYVEELLAPLGDVEARRMFGGVGVFHGERMFGLIHDDVLYFKVDEAGRAAYEAAGAGPFEYQTKLGKRGLASYWRVPDDVLEDGDEMVAWGRRAIAAALAGGHKGKAKGPRAGR